jgi:ATP-dependent Zn protease
MRKSQREKVVAFHEAGHAVVARALGITVKYATIVPSKGSAGSVAANNSALLSREPHVDVIEWNAMTVLAGPIAQMRFCPPTKTQAKLNWAGDIDCARWLVTRVVLARNNVPQQDNFDLPESMLREASELLDELMKKSDLLVSEHWAAIERVAEALIARRVLNQNDLDDLIADRRSLEMAL